MCASYPQLCYYTAIMLHPLNTYKQKRLELKIKWQKLKQTKTKHHHRAGRQQVGRSVLKYKALFIDIITRLNIALQKAKNNKYVH